MQIQCLGKLPFITVEHKVQEEIAVRVDSLQREGTTQ